MKRATLMTAALAPLLVASGLSSAANLPGSFPGVTIDAKLIGGQQYESLYAARIRRVGETHWRQGQHPFEEEWFRHRQRIKVGYRREIPWIGASAGITPHSLRNI